MPARVNKKAMPCNKPRRAPAASKKKRVVKDCSGGKEKIIQYGAKGYGNNYSSAARKSFKARHKCSSASKGTAKYWACKDLWGGKGGHTTSNPKSRKGKY